MKIVILEGYKRITNELVNWDFLDLIGTYDIYDYTATEDVYDRCFDAEMIILSKTIITDEDLKKLSKVKYIGVLATGYNNININLCNKLGITVTNVPAYSTDSVAQLIFSYILYFCNNVTFMNDSVKKGDWVRSPDFCYLPFSQVELTNKCIGIIGYGKIGKKVAKIAKAFKMKVYVYSSNIHNGVYNALLEELLADCDFITLTCPLTPKTNKMVDYKFLEKMKKTSYLINTSRGGLIDEDALAYSLNNNIIAGAALDVLAQEPPDERNPLLIAKNTIITSHVGWGSNESIIRMMGIVEKNIKAYLKNKPINVVK